MVKQFLHKKPLWKKWRPKKNEYELFKHGLLLKSNYFIDKKKGGWKVRSGALSARPRGPALGAAGEAAEGQNSGVGWPPTADPV
jgi:hypothetical protein